MGVACPFLPSHKWQAVPPCSAARAAGVSLPILNNFNFVGVFGGPAEEHGVFLVLLHCGCELDLWAAAAYCQQRCSPGWGRSLALRGKWAGLPAAPQNSFWSPTGWSYVV